MAEPGPLVHPKWARAMASAGAAMAAGAQALPNPWDVGLFVVGWCVAYAGGAQLQQPEWLKGRQVVELAAVPVLLALGGLAGAVSVWTPHLREIMGAVAVVCAVLAGKARQEAQHVPVVRNGAWPGPGDSEALRRAGKLVVLLLCAGALHGCATTRMLAEAPPEEVPHTLAPALETKGLTDEEREKECRHTYFWRLVAGVFADGCLVLAGGSAAGAVATACAAPAPTATPKPAPTQAPAKATTAPTAAPKPTTAQPTAVPATW